VLKFDFFSSLRFELKFRKLSNSRLADSIVLREAPVFETHFLPPLIQEDGIRTSRLTVKGAPIGLAGRD
jgi:hypothetical protein